MTSAWESLLQILPTWIRMQLSKQEGLQLREIRLRLGGCPELVLPEESRWLDREITGTDLGFCVQAASRYSPWAAETVNQGYITAPGGHRVGICGMAVYKNGFFSGIREITSLCIRVARDVAGIAGGIPLTGSVLILGAPGWGKTTLLRDYVRRRSERESVAVVDERGELFPDGFDRGCRTDVLTGARKPEGIGRVLRTMGPDAIAVDEITAEEDCRALCQAAGCGVRLIATAHAGSMEEFCGRPVYQKMISSRVFDSCVILQRDRSFRTERMRG